MRWFRFYNEALTDSKLRLVARGAEVSLCEAGWCWMAVLSYANDRQGEMRGTVTGIKAAWLAVTVDIEEDKARRVLVEFKRLGMLSGSKSELRVTAFERRNSEDPGAALRMARFRQKGRKTKQNQRHSVTDRNGYVTLREHVVTDDETASETPVFSAEKIEQNQCEPATKRNVTPKTRIEKKETPSSPVSYEPGEEGREDAAPKPPSAEVIELADINPRNVVWRMGRKLLGNENGALISKVRQQCGDDDGEMLRILQKLESVPPEGRKAWFSQAGLDRAEMRKNGRPPGRWSGAPVKDPRLDPELMHVPG